jgi:hypothetical protein
MTEAAMFQYKLKTLMLVMLGVCVFTWLFFVLPGEVGAIVLMCLMMIVPSSVLAGVLYFRGYPQAFAIGCVPPMLIIGTTMFFDGLDILQSRRGDDWEGKLVLLIWMMVILAAGAASAGVRWLAVWSRQPGIETKTFPGLSLEPPRTPIRSLTPDS